MKVERRQVERRQWEQRVEDDAARASDRAGIKCCTCLHLEGRVLASPAK